MLWVINQKKLEWPGFSVFGLCIHSYCYSRIHSKSRKNKILPDTDTIHPKHQDEKVKSKFMTFNY